MSTIHHIPDGYTTVTSWIISSNSVEPIKFLEKAFGAKEIEGSRMFSADVSVGHVEVKIGLFAQNTRKLRYYVSIKIVNELRRLGTIAMESAELDLCA